MLFPSPVNLVMRKNLVAQNQELQSGTREHLILHLSRPGCSALLDAAPFFWASVPYLLLVHLSPLKLFLLKVFLGFLCFAKKKKKLTKTAVPKAGKCNRFFPREELLHAKLGWLQLSPSFGRTQTSGQLFPVPLFPALQSTSLWGKTATCFKIQLHL